MNPCDECPFAYEASKTITAPLAALIVTQDIDRHIDSSEVAKAKCLICSNKKTRSLKLANDVREDLNHNQQRLFDISREKGCSTWLSALPISEFGFDLRKGTFRDALSLRYGW